MTLQYRTSDGALLWQSGGLGQGKLLGGCCCTSCETYFKDCPETLTMTLTVDEPGTDGKWMEGVHTLTKTAPGVYGGSATLTCFAGSRNATFVYSCDCNSTQWKLYISGPRNCKLPPPSNDGLPDLFTYCWSGVLTADPVCANTGALTVDGIFGGCDGGYSSVITAVIS